MLTESAPDFEPDLLEQQRLASLELAAPRRDGYEILELIGEGTYGNVWKARETQTGVTVAIKRLRRRPDEASCDEVKRLASLGAARGIIALREVHLDSEPYCYVMEYLGGGTLGDLTAEKGALPFREAWHIFRQLTEALCYVHKAEIIHCDLKPDNILLDSRGHVRIGDFGQARGQGPQGSSLGTRFYMPPEQARLDMPQPQWDVYALGAILYELLTGTKPRYDAQLASLLSTRSSTGSEMRDRLETYARHLEKAAPPLTHRGVKKVDSCVAALIERCLALDLDQRPQDAAAVLKLIEQCEHARHSRPLLIFGGLAPAIMMLVVGVIIFLAGWFSLGKMEQDWKERVKTNNPVIAKAIADEVQAMYQEQAEAVIQEARRQPLIQVMRDYPDLAGGREERIAVLKEALGRRGARIYRWTLTNAKGEQVCNYGRLESGNGDDAIREHDENYGKNFAWRGWFNGHADRQERTTPSGEDLQDFRQRRRTSAFVTPPFARKGTRRFLVVSISCPIAEQDDSEPIGVLSGIVNYDDFFDRINRIVRQLTASEQKIVIVDDKDQVLFHSDQEAWAAAGGQDAEFKVPRSDQYPYDRGSTGRNSDSPQAAASYVDPIDHHVYLGAPHVVELKGKQRLAVFVQQQNPMTGLWRGAIWLASGLTVVGIVVLATNSYALYWTLRQQREGGGHV